MAKRVALASGSPLLPDVGMSQSSLMVGALLAGFVVWLGMQGKLAAYWSILMGGGSTATASSTATSASPSTTAPSTASPSTVSPSNASLGLPATQGSILGLGGTSSTSTVATGGVGTATPTGVAGFPNTSLSTFFGLGG